MQQPPLDLLSGVPSAPRSRAAGRRGAADRRGSGSCAAARRATVRSRLRTSASHASCPATELQPLGERRHRVDRGDRPAAAFGSVAPHLSLVGTNLREPAGRASAGSAAARVHRGRQRRRRRSRCRARRVAVRGTPRSVARAWQAPRRAARGATRWRVARARRATTASAPGSRRLAPRARSPPTARRGTRRRAHSRAPRVAGRRTCGHDAVASRSSYPGSKMSSMAGHFRPGLTSTRGAGARPLRVARARKCLRMDAPKGSRCTGPGNLRSPG